MQDDNQKYNIICLSNQLWDFPNWTNKRHVMSRLAKLGHNVLFVDPPINTGNVFFRQIQRGLWGLGRLLTQHKKDPSGALVYTPLNIVTDQNFTTKQHIKRIQKLSRKFFNPELRTILWVYHVQMVNLEKYLNELKNDFLIYDCVDNYEGFPSDNSFYSTVVPKSKVVEQERLLTQKADLVFATAPGLVSKLQQYNSKVFFTPNVGDYEKFKNVEELRENLPNDLKNIKRPRIGFTGSLDEYKFDAKLMRKAALENPDFSFVLIGQIALKDKNAGLRGLGLNDIPNIYFLGYKPFDIIQKYFAGFDGYIIPFQLNDYTVGGCFPIKFHDALAAGLPTVVTDLPAYMPFEKVTYISKNYDQFSKNIKRAIDEDTPDRVSARKAVAKENSWEGKVQKLLLLISSGLQNQ